jgi:hypothetical protein
MSESWLDTIKSSFTTQTATWFVGVAITILGIFSARITEAIKFALNRADLRTSQQEELSAEISQYIFSAELNTEFVGKGWTTKQTMSDLLREYNQSITTIRRKEFVYSAWVEKYWGRKQAGLYDTFMNSAREFDNAIHSLNDEFEAVNILESKKKIDSKVAEESLKLMRPAVENLRKNGRAFLTSLQ